MWQEIESSCINFILTNVSLGDKSMRKCDWCKKNSVCRGVVRSECIVSDYRNFCPEDVTNYTMCSFCGKDLSKELSTGEIRGGLRSKVLAKLCGDCYRKYMLIQQGSSILE